MEIDLQLLSVVRPDGPGVPAGTVTIVQFPTPENNFTIIVEFDDLPQPGSAFYHVKLRIRTLPVIDIKPGSFPNSINPRSKGVIPVAILTTNSFDATAVDPTTVLFGPTGTEAASVHSALEDVDGDGDTDMILHFNTLNTGILCGDTSASLTGDTFGGQAIKGSDSIKTAGCK